MAAVPTMMVLYSNDAVDVRYSDGSLLQLSPCGSSMFHQDPPTDMPRHPLAGVQGVKKWTQFVTSAHKAKVLQAVDFRNRFASRPFLCPSLMAPEDIVSLYARIDQIAWGRTAEESHVEVFEDGSRRAVSRDEYASLVLSPHGQDFTVCYLSRISPDSVTSPGPQPAQPPSQQDREVSVLTDPDPSQPFPEAGSSHHEDGGDTRLVQTEAAASDDARAVCRKPSLPCGAGDTATNRRDNNNSSSSTPVSEVPLSGDATVDVSGLILSEGTPLSTPGRSAQAVDVQSSVFSVQHDISSISRVSTPDGLRGMVECDDTLPLAEDMAAVTSAPSAAGVLHSSPLNLVNTVSCTGKGDGSREAVGGVELNNALKESEATERKSVGSQCVGSTVERGVPAGRERESTVSRSGHVHVQGNDGHVHVQGNDGHVHVQGNDARSTTGCARAEPTDPALSSDRTIPEQAGESSTHSSPVTHPSRTCRGQKESSASRGGSGDQVYSGAGRSHDSGSSGGGVGAAPSSQVWAGGRQHYSWVTQHISCNSCPPAWRHPLRLLQQTDPTTSILASECNLTVSTNIAKGLRHINAADASKCVMSSVTSPLSLTCPFQHLHQWQSPQDNGDDDGEGLSAESISPFKQGQLKVLMMEGVVYRFVDVANMKVVEIYPGDGSVLISQGATARFFSHLTWKDGKLEEKTYSVKMLPPKPPSAPYSVQHLISRGHRLLTGCIHNSPLSEREALPCWKQAVTHVVEPLSSSLLEECSVNGYGRFTAYSNGRVRVLFEDRTALDMMADFSRRLHDCVKHSSDSEVSMEEKLAALKLTSGNTQLRNCQCRLLLPSGKYVMVELFKPGPYRRYVDAAKEWVQWVQSSPKERRQFYQEKATPHSARRSAEAELKKIECFNYIVDHSAIPTSAMNDTSHPSASTSLSQPLPPPPSHLSAYSSAGRPLSHVAPIPVPQRSANLQAASCSSGFGHREGTPDVRGKSGLLPSDPKDVAMLQGFHSVREALLRTSQMIREIDDIVKDHKESGSTQSQDGTPAWNL